MFTKVLGGGAGAAAGTVSGMLMRSKFVGWFFCSDQFTLVNCCTWRIIPVDVSSQ